MLEQEYEMTSADNSPNIIMPSTLTHSNVKVLENSQDEIVGVIKPIAMDKKFRELDGTKIEMITCSQGALKLSMDEKDD
jgi:hypothetical protein